MVRILEAARPRAIDVGFLFAGASLQRFVAVSLAVAVVMAVAGVVLVLIGSYPVASRATDGAAQPGVPGKAVGQP